MHAVACYYGCYRQANGRQTVACFMLAQLLDVIQKATELSSSYLLIPRQNFGPLPREQANKKTQRVHTVARQEAS